eukprot:CAMPEP_0180528794 /NCGR_PEP_ID=MMETSP1036_2-20121128/60998_1 /TAXON_ID=632150 /ORGANISM="Azadinium spinosum, Strain 3D9" /LENGTH=89 /DNA_ID=CAMNT_0022542397 /DNA_START=94 /DNA_END=360 /DNA_ORIENTATION=+
MTLGSNGWQVDGPRLDSVILGRPCSQLAVRFLASLDFLGGNVLAFRCLASWGGMLAFPCVAFLTLLEGRLQASRIIQEIPYAETSARKI